MKCFVGLGLALALFASGAQAAAVQPPPGKTPQQAADLIMAAMLTGDGADVRALNDYLRPRFDGRDAFDAAILTGMMDHIADGLAAMLRQQLGTGGAEKDRATTAIARSFVAAIRRSRCHATGAREKPGEAGSRAADVDYECLVPDAARAIKPLGFPNDTSITADQLVREAAVLDAAPADKRVTGTMTLDGGQDGRFWTASSPSDAVGAVIEGIVGELAS